MKLTNFLLPLLTTLVFFLIPASAYSKSYSSLKSNGFRTGGLTNNRAGVKGWVLSKGAERYFCRSRISLMILNKTTMIAFASSGRLIKLDRAAYENRAGGAAKHFPKYSDVKKGRVDKKFVNRCRKLK